MSRIIQLAYEKVVENIINTIAWVHCTNTYQTSLPSNDIILVNPQQIMYKPTSKPKRNLFCPILDGSWDINTKLVSDDPVYTALYKRFEEGLDWNETGYIEFIKKDYSEHGGSSYESALERAKTVENIYLSIKKNGYLSQSDLDKQTEGFKLRPAKFREVSITIGRDGQILWQSGMHRLCIAKLLDIDHIPVRVYVRHEKWQSLREEYAKGQISSESKRLIKDHPDIIQINQ